MQIILGLPRRTEASLEHVTLKVSWSCKLRVLSQRVRSLGFIAIAERLSTM